VLWSWKTLCIVVLWDGSTRAEIFEAEHWPIPDDVAIKNKWSYTYMTPIIIHVAVLEHYN
jgi:hypothetical protein